MYIGNKSKVLSGLFLIVLVVLSGCLSSESIEEKYGEELKAVLYKSPSCGCCTEYGKYLQSKGFEVETKLVNNLNSLKQEYNIPFSMDSCHITLIGDYFIEGHVPMEGVDKLLLEKPNVDGIALPGMPSGTPGMPGPQTEPYVIYSIKDGAISQFLVIE